MANKTVQYPMHDIHITRSSPQTRTEIDWYEYCKQLEKRIEFLEEQHDIIRDALVVITNWLRKHDATN